MSKQLPHYQCRVMHDIQCLSIEQLEELYDIEIDEDGFVWDNCEGKQFKTLQQWALFIEELHSEDEDEDLYIVKTGKRRYDDDY